MAVRNVICSPGSYVQGGGELGKLAEHYAAFGKKGAYIIVGPHVCGTYHDQIVSSFEADSLPYVLQIFGGECSQQEIDRHCALLGSCDAVIGIGGGKTLDTAKAVAYYAHLPVLIVPTAAASDAPCSRLSVLYTPQGEFDRYLFLPKNPDLVLMDLDIIAGAPVRLLRAGIADALATWYEADACCRAHGTTPAGGHATLSAMALAKLCRDTLLENGEQAVADVRQGRRTEAVDHVIEANTYMSGVGFESGGLSAAHAIHNGLTVLPQCHGMLHGEKVAFGLLTMLVLECLPQEEIRRIFAFCRSVGLPTTLAQLGLDAVEDTDLLRAAAAACAPGETMENLSFEATPHTVFFAMKAADLLGRELR